MTNKEKFREIFGVNIIDDKFVDSCTNFSCYGTYCKECTFNKPHQLNKSIWDLEYKEPIQEFENINVGDKVSIRDDDYQYSTYNSLFNRSNLSGETISRFNSGVRLNTELTYIVLEILEHDNFDNVYIAVIQNEFDDVYLIGVEGLEVI